MTEENIKNKPIYLESYKLNTDLLLEELKIIKNDTLKQIGNNFHNNVMLVGSMIVLPEIICFLENVKWQGYFRGYKTGLDAAGSLSEKATDEEIRKLADSFWQTEEKIIIKKAMKDTGESFRMSMGNTQLYESYRSLLYAGIVFTWCSFEVCMKDLWETTLNIGNKLVMETMLKNITNVDKINDFYGIKGKYINLEYLAQYNYNISDKLGSVLVNKFDFSSVYGIKEAYLCAFPKSATIKKALENKELLQLEARRHIIVHKTGIIDDVFCKKAGISKTQIGDKLEISDEELSNFGNVSIDTVIRIIKSVSTILSDGKAQF